MHYIAQGWLIYSLTKSAFYLGIVGMAMSLPMLLFTLIGGLIADRFKKRKVMVLTQSVSILPVLTLAILTDIKMINIREIMIISFMIGTINAVDIPARQSFLVEMVGKGNLLNAIALNSTAFNGARMIGPVIAGIIVSRFDIASCFYLNAFSYIPVVFVLSKILSDGFTPIKRAENILKDFFDGIHFIKNSKKITGIILTIAVFSIFGIPFGQFLPLFADRVLHSGVEVYSYLISSMGLGALSAGLIIAFKGNIKRKRVYMSITGFCFVFSLMIFSLSENFIISLFFLYLTGWSIVSFLAISNSFIQLEVSDEIRGRVMSVYSLMFLGMTPLGYYIMGTFTEQIGIRKMIFISAIICLTGFISFKRKWKG